MNESRGRLRIIPYDPNDYSLGEALTVENGTKISDPKLIGAALSLYFQWPAHRLSNLIWNEAKTPQASSCELDYDKDERSPTELRIKYNENVATSLREFDEIRIRFEVFRSCYEFSARILALSTSPKEDGFSAIIAVPDFIVAYKARRLPRLSMPQNEDTPKIEVSISDENSIEKKYNLFISEIGLKSIKLISDFQLPLKDCKLLINNKKISGKIVKADSNACVAVLNITSPAEFGHYFDFYRKYAYPSLRSRYEFPLNAGITLYKDANYFGKFEGNQFEESISHIIDNWKDLENGSHLTNADYYIVDDSNVPVGSSGIALAFFSEGNPVWIFHQLCALKNPALVKRSGYLYTWRAEYLAARPENLTVAVWFDSRSRWLERLYVKFSQQSKSGVSLSSVQDKHCHFQKSDTNTSVELKNYKLGNSDRWVTTAKNIWAGIGPRYLNANGYLDCIVNLEDSEPSQAVKEIGGTLLSAANIDSLSILVTVRQDASLESIDGRPQLSDRFCKFDKLNLIDFLISVEHSIAITERKLGNG